MNFGFVVSLVLVIFAVVVERSSRPDASIANGPSGSGYDTSATPYQAIAARNVGSSGQDWPAFQFS